MAAMPEPTQQDVNEYVAQFPNATPEDKGHFYQWFTAKKSAELDQPVNVGMGITLPRNQAENDPQYRDMVQGAGQMQQAIDHPIGNIAARGADIASNVIGLGASTGTGMLLKQLAGETPGLAATALIPQAENAAFTGGQYLANKTMGAAGIPVDEPNYGAQLGIGAGLTAGGQALAGGINYLSGATRSAQTRALALAPGEIASRLSGVPRTTAPSQMALYDELISSPGAQNRLSVEQRSSRNKILEYANGTYNDTLGVWEPITKDPITGEVKRVEPLGPIADPMVDRKDLSNRANLIRTQANILSSKREMALTSMDRRGFQVDEEGKQILGTAQDDVSKYNQERVLKGEPQFLGTHFNDVLSSDAGKKISARVQQLQGTGSGAEELSGLQEAMAEFKTDYDALAPQNPTVFKPAVPGMPGAPDPGMTLSQLHVSRDNLLKQVRAGGKFNPSIEAKAMMDPAAKQAMENRLNGATQVLGMVDELIKDHADRLFDSGISKTLSGNQLLNLNQDMRSAILIGDNMDYYAKTVGTSAPVTNASSLMDRSTGNIKTGPSGIGAAINPANLIRAVDKKLTPVGSTVGASMNARREVIGNMNEGMDMAKIQRVLAGAEESKGSPLSPMEEVQALRQYGLDAKVPLPLTGSGGGVPTALAVNNVLNVLGGNNTKRDKQGNPTAASPMSPAIANTPMAIDNHHSIDRHVLAIDQTPPEYKNGILAALGGPVDGPALVHQSMNIKQPEQKAKFWTQISRQFPEFPFASGMTGLPSEFDAGNGPKLYDPLDVKTWANNIANTNLREDVKAQLVSALFRDGTLYPLDKAGSLVSLSPQSQLPDGSLASDMLDTVRRSASGRKQDLVS
jgi:hypothetical protein